MNDRSTATMTEQKVIMHLEPVDKLRPSYLNSFRNTEHYQNSLTYGVQTEEDKIIPITLSDILGASPVMEKVFADVQVENGHIVTFKKGLYQSPTMRVVAFGDKIRLTRAVHPKAFGDAIYVPEIVLGYAAALERIGTIEKGMKRIKKEETRQSREWCIKQLEDLIESREGLNASFLTIINTGGENPRIKNTKTARQAYEKIIEFYISQLQSANKRIVDLITPHGG